MGSNCLTKRQKPKAFVSHKGLNVISSVFFPASFQKRSQTCFISFAVVLFMLLLHAFTERKCFEICFSLWVCARLKLDAVFSPVNYYFGKFIVLNLSPH